MVAAAALFNRANAQSGLGHPAEAIADYGRALEKQPEFPEAAHNRGNVYLEQGQNELRPSTIRALTWSAPASPPATRCGCGTSTHSATPAALDTSGATREPSSAVTAPTPSPTSKPTPAVGAVSSRPTASPSTRPSCGATRASRGSPSTSTCGRATSNERRARPMLDSSERTIPRDELRTRSYSR